MKTARHIAVCLLTIVMSMGINAQTMVYLEHSDILRFDEARLPDAQILQGNVQFRHDSAHMFCDSAYFYPGSNSITAMGHVRFEQGDTLHGYGDKLYYNGNTQLARLCKHVKLIHRSATLTTDSLNYDRLINRAYYFTGGVIKDSVNTLESVWGEYVPSDCTAEFRNQVHLKNNSFTLDTDTLKYNTKTNVAHLVSETKIVYEGETTIYSHNGWYNTATEQSMLLSRSRIIHTDGKLMTGDTIFYDKQRGYGQMLRNMLVADTTQHLTLTGNYGEVWEKEEKGFVTNHAMLEDWSTEKHTYLSADSIHLEKIAYRDSTLDKDTTYQQVRAFNHVRGYNMDYQLTCDSLTYNGRDSIIVLHHQPLCWSDSSQMAADSITLYMKDGAVDRIYGVGFASMVQREDSIRFDQLAGRTMMAYIREGELRQVDVSGNAESVFFPRDDEQDIVGVNKTQSSCVQIYLNGQKVHHVLFTTTTNGTMYPLDQIQKEDTFLSTYFWAEKERPMRPQDIFLRPEKTIRPAKTTASASE